MPSGETIGFMLAYMLYILCIGAGLCFLIWVFLYVTGPTKNTSNNSWMECPRGRLVCKGVIKIGQQHCPNCGVFCNWPQNQHEKKGTTP